MSMISKGLSQNNTLALSFKIWYYLIIYNNSKYIQLINALLSDVHLKYKTKLGDWYLPKVGKLIKKLIWVSSYITLLVNKIVFV